MPLAHNFREDYYARLERCLDIIELNEKYTAKRSEYERLLIEINARLEALDSIVKNAEDLLDGKTGGLKRGAKLAVGGDTELLGKLNELAALGAELAGFIGMHSWDDGVMNSIDAVLAIASYEELEQQMLAELGRDAAERIIYEEKKRISAVERERGMYFFADGVALMETLFKIRTLCPTATELSLDRKDNYDTIDLELTNDRGQRIRFRKTGQIFHESALYVELVLLDDLRIRRQLQHYRVEQTHDGLVLTLVEDEELHNILFSKIENLIK